MCSQLATTHWQLPQRQVQIRERRLLQLWDHSLTQAGTTSTEMAPSRNGSREIAEREQERQLNSNWSQEALSSFGIECTLLLLASFVM